MVKGSKTAKERGWAPPLQKPAPKISEDFLTSFLYNHEVTRLSLPLFTLVFTTKYCLRFIKDYMELEKPTNSKHRNKNTNWQREGVAQTSHQKLKKETGPFFSWLLLLSLLHLNIIIVIIAIITIWFLMYLLTLNYSWWLLVQWNKQNYFLWLLNVAERVHYQTLLATYSKCTVLYSMNSAWTMYNYFELLYTCFFWLVRNDDLRFIKWCVSQKHKKKKILE